jgi:hypothetical protein
MLQWDQYGFDIKRVGTHYDELMFLHPAGFGVHVMHSCASGVQKVHALFFMLGWDRYGFDKKRIEKRYVELVCFAFGGICVSRSPFRCIRA